MSLDAGSSGAGAGHSVVAEPPTDGVGHSVFAEPPTDCADHSAVADPPLYGAGHSVVAEPPTDCAGHSAVVEPPLYGAGHSVVAEPQPPDFIVHSAGSFGIVQSPDSDVHSVIRERYHNLQREGYHCLTESDIYTIVTRVNVRTHRATDGDTSNFDEDDLFDIQTDEIRRCLIALGRVPVDYVMRATRAPTTPGPALVQPTNPGPALVPPRLEARHHAPRERYTIVTPLWSTVAVEARDHPPPDLPGLAHHAPVRRETLRVPVHPYGGGGGRNGGGGGSSGGGGN